MYRRVEIPSRKTKTVGQLLSGYDKGSDPGSLYYLRHSTHYLIRTKALQDYSTLISTKGDAITPVNPRVFCDQALKDGDILLHAAFVDFKILFIEPGNCFSAFVHHGSCQADKHHFHLQWRKLLRR